MTHVHPHVRLMVWLTISLLTMSAWLPHAHSETLRLNAPQSATCPKLYSADPTQPTQCKFTGLTVSEADCAPAAEFTYKVGFGCTPKQAVVSPNCPDIKGYVSAVVVSDDGKTAQCRYTRPDLPSSHAGDYEGDCFRLKTPLGGLPAGTRLIVSEQSKPSTDPDPDLVLVRGVNWGVGMLQDFVPGWLSCRVDESDHPPVKLSASELARSGATRRGYSYGLLTMPYKYFPGSKEFIAGLPVGGYLGWRAGQPGSAFTVAVAATLSTVQGKTYTTDANGVRTDTGSTNLSALSWAIGATFDVTRRPGSQAFKSGIFVGRDHVNLTPNVDYKYNNKTWVAIQIGFDFTDY